MSSDSWRGLENSLQILRLGKNSIDRLPADAFTGLSSLQTLDLSDNSIRDIDPFVFRDGMTHLNYIYLSNNQIMSIPYSQIFLLKQLKILDLSYNRITRMTLPQYESEISGIKISLDVLRLDYNQIDVLYSNAFKHFLKINQTFLTGNPIKKIQV